MTKQFKFASALFAKRRIGGVSLPQFAHRIGPPKRASERAVCITELPVKLPGLAVRQRVDELPSLLKDSRRISRRPERILNERLLSQSYRTLTDPAVGYLGRDQGGCRRDSPTR
jgi:hypothetical protein